MVLLVGWAASFTFQVVTLQDRCYTSLDPHYVQDENPRTDSTGAAWWAAPESHWDAFPLSMNCTIETHGPDPKPSAPNGVGEWLTGNARVWPTGFWFVIRAHHYFIPV